jgi:hypothetical protein
MLLCNSSSLARFSYLATNWVVTTFKKVKKASGPHTLLFGVSPSTASIQVITPYDFPKLAWLQRETSPKLLGCRGRAPKCYRYNPVGCNLSRLFATVSWDDLVLPVRHHSAPSRFYLLHNAGDAYVARLLPC